MDKKDGIVWESDIKEIMICLGSGLCFLLFPLVIAFTFVWEKVLRNPCNNLVADVWCQFCDYISDKQKK